MSLRTATITIHSVGLLGGSLGLALKASGFAGRIIGLSSEKSRSAALSMGCIDEAVPYEALPEVVKRTDILFLCSPISAILQSIEALGSLSLPEGLVVTDIGSTKARIVEQARASLPAHVHFLGGHPMAGSEKSGVSSADPFLFQNAVYALVPAQDTPSPVDEAFAAFIDRYLGCRHLFLNAATHDAIAATVSHVPHLLAVALVNLARHAEVLRPGTLSLAAGGFRDMTRIASAPYGMWHDIFSTNTSTVASIIDEYIAILGDMRTRLNQGHLAELFAAAAQTRATIPATSKGFISQLHEILVVAKDQPGVIASIATALGDASVNIKDIEVMKVREGEGGTIRLAFESHEVARTAIEIVKKHGFSARVR